MLKKFILISNDERKLLESDLHQENLKIQIDCNEKSGNLPKYNILSGFASQNATRI